jgi:hypothetical protein
LIVINSHSEASERWYVDISLPPGHEKNKPPVYRRLVISVAAVKKPLLYIYKMI